MNDDRLERLFALKSAAESISNPETSWGKEARRQLLSTGLSPEGIEFALTHCLEHTVSRSTLSGMVRQTKLEGRCHVLLSASVFVSAFRAIVLGLCQSPQLIVRASQRAPQMSHLLHQASGEAFELSKSLSPCHGDHFWAYGSDETLRKLRRTLPTGVHFHGHGHGMGASVFRETHEVRSSDLEKGVDGLARDTIAFDQRGCLSPRVVLVEGSRTFAETVCSLLVESLSHWEDKVPRGTLSPEETADALRYEASMTYVGSSLPAGMGLVFLDPEDARIIVPPIGRYLHVSVCGDAFPLLQSLGNELTTISFFNGQQLPGRLRDSIGDRRYVDMGEMQSPRLDGPVDLRHGWSDEIL